MAVVGETFADGQRGLLALRVGWNDEYAERRSSEELLREHQPLVESGERAVVTSVDCNIDDGFLKATHIVDAFYELPYLAHAPMEPNNAVCRMNEDGLLEVWAGTESPVYTQMTGAGITGLQPAFLARFLDCLRIAIDTGGDYTGCGAFSESGATGTRSSGVYCSRAGHPIACGAVPMP